MTTVSRSDLMRRRGGHDDGKVDFVELFFDLVFVFAVTQLSHSLLAHFTPLGVLETSILFMAVWWVWIYMPLSHIVGLVLLGLLVPFATTLSPLTLGAATTAVLAVVAVWERVSLGGAAEP
jgi:low temperature requirement protein LtrA